MKNILFDLDGTLGDTLPLCIAAFREAIEPLAGRSVSDSEILATFGPSEEGTIRALIPDYYDEGVQGYLDSYKRLHPTWPDPFDGIHDILQFLKSRNCFVALVTGKGEMSTVLTLESYDLTDYFDAVKTGSPEGPVKELRIEEVIAAHALRREETLYVGDSPGDITASRTCGINVVAAAWAPSADIEELKSHQPDHLFTSVADFDAMVRSLLS
mgnify:CR=1 FL=1